MSARKWLSFRGGLLGALLILSPAVFATEIDTGGRTVRYFLGFAGKTLPFKPKEEVSREQALASNPYCIVEYEDGRIVRFTKMLDGERFFDHQFTYSADGTVETVVLTRADGSQRRIDGEGNPMRPSE